MQLCAAGMNVDGEPAQALAFFEQGKQLAGDDEKQHRQVLVNYCQALLSTAEFRNLD